MRGRAIVIGLLLATLMFSFPSAFAYTIPNTCRSEAQNSTTTQCILTVQNVGDLMVIETQAQDSQSAGHTEIHVTGVTGGGTWNLAKAQSLSVGGNCMSGNCFDAEIWFFTATASGSTTITVTYSQNFGNAGAQVQGEDFVGVSGTDLRGSSSFTCSSSCGSAFSTTGSVSVNTNDVTVSSIWTTCEASNTLSAGAGYTKISPAALLEGAGEYGSPPTYSGVSPTTFPWFCSASQSTIIDVGAVIGKVLDVIKVVPCTFTQIQCWWYPMLFYGVFASGFLMVGKAGAANGREMTYLLLAGLTFCSMIQVQMNMTNIMMPMILSIIGIVYSVRGR